MYATSRKQSLLDNPATTVFSLGTSLNTLDLTSRTSPIIEPSYIDPAVAIDTILTCKHAADSRIQR
jgi:hypothetical protein